MKKYIFSSLILNFLLFSNIEVYGINNEEDETSPNYHRHLPKDVPFMKVNDDHNKYDYEVDDESFDKIHPPMRFDEEGFNDNSCQVILENGSMGSGNVTSIKEDKEEIRSEILTARHVVEDSKTKTLSFPDVFQGMSSFEDGSVAYLAKHEIDEICFNPTLNSDIALLKGRVTENNMNDKLFKTPAQIQSKKDHIESPIYEGYMSHYPLGVFTQRFNIGNIFRNGEHSISSLPGSSGAGIFNLMHKLAWVHSGSSEMPSPVRVFYNVSILSGLPWSKKILQLSEKNKSNSIFEEDIKGFCNCYKRSTPHFSNRF
jgi:hypothetical protein